MPTLDWIGKNAVVEHHKQVPFHLLKSNDELSVGEPGAGNLLVQGDNLLALKALLPYYAGQVKCIYIDPPYNTGNESWVYNDNVNSPEMREWLGKAVGKEAEDLSRHDKWLCMMYPRLVLLYQMLSDDGAIFISLDDHEIGHLRSICDEIFGVRNFVTTICWQKIYTVKNSARHFSEMHDYIVIYSKDSDRWQRNLLLRTEKQDRAYENPDNDPRGPWKATPLHARNYYSQGLYPISSPSGRIIEGPPKGTYWRYPETKLKELIINNQIWWGKYGNSIPSQKRFLTDVKAGVIPATMWFYNEAGHNAEAKNELRSVLHDTELFFITPKPVKLLTRILEIASNENDLILDSFAGSGTTGHAVLQLNKQDGGKRRFILIEMEQDICRNVTAERLRRVCNGYQKPDGSTIEGLGAGFRFCQLGDPLFNPQGHIGDSVTFKDLAHHVFFIATGEPLPYSADLKTPLLGVTNSVAVYLLFNGILGDKSVNGGNVLTREIMASLPSYEGTRIIYGNGCRISPERLRRENIIFRQVPYEVRVS